MQHSDMEFAVQKICQQYTQKKPDRLEELKKLDAKAKRPANVFAYTFGSIAAMVMGTGMSLVMTELAQLLQLGQTVAMTLGIAIGVVGLVLVALAYPVYNRVLRRERQRIAPQILQLSDELLK